MKSIKNMESEIEAMGGLEDGHQNRKKIENTWVFSIFLRMPGKWSHFGHGAPNRKKFVKSHVFFDFFTVLVL